MVDFYSTFFSVAPAHMHAAREFAFSLYRWPTVTTHNTAEELIVHFPTLPCNISHLDDVTSVEYILLVPQQAPDPGDSLHFDRQHRLRFSFEGVLGVVPHHLCRGCLRGKRSWDYVISAQLLSGQP